MKQSIFTFATIMLIAFGVCGCKNSPKENKLTEQITKDTIIQDTTTIEVDTARIVSVADLSEPSGYINGHGYVDLGLSVKWATCNIGANSPFDYGDYFAWGETKTKSSYTGNNSVTEGKNMWDIAGNPTYDAARANWGGMWRLPTLAEIDELINKCTLTWTAEGEYRGYIFIGPNGNSIFLPAAGDKFESSTENVGSAGLYWTATSLEGGGIDDSASSLTFGSNYIYVEYDFYRNGGQSIRPVFNND